VSKIIDYAQGYAVIGKAAKEYKWELGCGAIALI